MEEDDHGNISYGFQTSHSKRTRIFSDSNKQVQRDGNSSGQTSPLGLTLSKTPSFLNLVQMKLSQARSKSSSPETHNQSNRDPFGPKMDDFESQSMSEKLKASNFPALFLKIGSWERFSRHEGDLVAKCYYAKKKIVWEVLNGALKSKIEIQWSDIMAIRATIVDDQPGILEIELNQPPQFFREMNPQPRKHTLWHPASDFTGGQAPSYRRHYIRFPPGTLDKHYEKLLQCDRRLFELSQRPFPRLESPYFYSNIAHGTDISFDFRACQPQVPFHGMQYSFPPIPPSSLQVPSEPVQSHGQTFGFVDSYSPMSVMDFPQTSDYPFQNQWAAAANWGGADRNNSENLYANEDQIQGLPVLYNNTSATQDGMVFSNHVPAYHGEVKMPDSNNRMLSDIENHFLDDSLFSCSDESNLLARMRSMCSMLEPQELSTFSHQNIGANHIAYGHETYVRDTVVSQRLDMDGSALPHMQPNNYFPPQVTHGNPTTSQLATDNYQYEFSDQRMNDYEDVGTSQDNRQW